jgi:hypothetical protein
MKFTLKKVFIVLTILFVGILASSQVFADDFRVKINCDGKTIKMTSETPDMTWRVNDILPGETDQSTVILQNIGKKKVDVNLSVKIESGEDLVKILDLKIIQKHSSDNQEKTVFEGKYSDLQSLNVSIDPQQKLTYTFIATLPLDTGNEFQGAECVVKFVLVSSGDADKKSEPTPEPTPEPEPEKIITDDVEPAQTGEGIIIYIIAGVLLIAAIVFLVTFFLNRKDKEK